VEGDIVGVRPASSCLREAFLLDVDSHDGISTGLAQSDRVVA
jgi:hypothetical protein